MVAYEPRYSNRICVELYDRAESWSRARMRRLPQHREGEESRPTYHNDPFAKCLNSSGRGFSRPVDFYVSQVTEFYESFPSDRAIPFEEVLKRLSDSELMTPKQIHDWFERHARGK